MKEKEACLFSLNSEFPIIKVKFDDGVEELALFEYGVHTLYANIDNNSPCSGHYLLTGGAVPLDCIKYPGPMIVISHDKDFLQQINVLDYYYLSLELRE